MEPYRLASLALARVPWLMEAFSDLPDALVRDLLAEAQNVSGSVVSHLDALTTSRSAVRAALDSHEIIAHRTDLDVPREPSVVGVDGSYQIHSLTAIDLCAAAAVAVEGTSKEATRHWQEPYHRMWVGSFPHSRNSTNTLRGLMIAMELDLASVAPHDLVMLDGSFIVMVIYLNQGLTSVAEAPRQLADELLGRWNAEDVFGRLMGLLGSQRAIALPKYSGRNELQDFVPESTPATDGKTLATLVLHGDEYTAPLPIYRFAGEDTEYHLPKEYVTAPQIETMNRAIEGLRVVFYRPFGWCPAVRIEMPSSIASSPHRLAMVLEGVRSQHFSPAVFEPYPLFLADRMVKSLGSGVNVIEQAVAQIAADETDDLERTLLFLQNYRTQGGRAGV